MTPTAGPSLGPLHSPSLRDRDRAEARARRNPLVWLREILIIIVVALVISSLLRAFIVQVFWIPSGWVPLRRLLPQCCAVWGSSPVSSREAVNRRS